MEKMQCALSNLQLTKLSKQVAKPLQYTGCHPITRYNSAVMNWFGTMDEFFMIMTGKEKSAHLLVFKLIQ
jgi:hypothetical protein